MRRALVSALLFLAACVPADAPADAPASDGGDGAAVVTRVVDGDTVEVEFEGLELDVRLIGIDTPETVKPGEPVECFGPQASAYTEDRLEGRTVRLEFDVERIDPFDRTLAYVWVGDELFNETLVREGTALVTTFPPNVKYVDRFRDAQRLARDEGLGLWSACR